MKDGIFSQVTVLPHESQDDYDAHLARIWKACDPQGGFEELLVDKLVSNLWRQRRMLVAEGAEIRIGRESCEQEFRDEQAQLPETTVGFLDKIKHEIKDLGFEHASVADNLLTIYGAGSEWPETLYQRYRGYIKAAELFKKGNRGKGSLSLEECKKKFESELSSEIQRLREQFEQRASLGADRMNLEMLRRNVPKSAKLDRLLKYGASLAREFDRTLNQLERLQRMRAGLPVPPVLKV